ncbi:hypothetical protein V1515DRAFT_606948 [Lipomyces mesembrius]
MWSAYLIILSFFQLGSARSYSNPLSHMAVAHRETVCLIICSLLEENAARQDPTSQLWPRLKISNYRFWMLEGYKTQISSLNLTSLTPATQ